MGETGCGKTTLVRFMCALRMGPKSEDEQTRTPNNMVLVKVSYNPYQINVIQGFWKKMYCF